MTEPAAPYDSKAETPGEDREFVDLEAAVQRTPVDAGAWLALARGYRDRGHHELSAEALQRATLLDPRSAAAWYRLSIARSRLEQSKEALAAARRAAALDSGLDETGRPEAAVWALETAVFAAPDWGWAWGRLGKARRALGRHDDAVEAFEKSVEHGRARLRTARAVVRMGHSAAELRDVARVRRACRELGRLDAPDLARTLRARLRRLRAAARQPAPAPALAGAPPLAPGRRLESHGPGSPS